MAGIFWPPVWNCCAMKASRRSGRIGHGVNCGRSAFYVSTLRPSLRRDATEARQQPRAPADELSELSSLPTGCGNRSAENLNLLSRASDGSRARPIGNYDESGLRSIFLCCPAGCDRNDGRGSESGRRHACPYRHRGCAGWPIAVVARSRSRHSGRQATLICVRPEAGASADCRAGCASMIRYRFPLFCTAARFGRSSCR